MTATFKFLATLATVSWPHTDESLTRLNENVNRTSAILSSFGMQRRKISSTTPWGTTSATTGWCGSVCPIKWTRDSLSGWTVSRFLSALFLPIHQPPHPMVLHPSPVFVLFYIINFSLPGNFSRFIFFFFLVVSPFTRSLTVKSFLDRCRTVLFVWRHQNEVLRGGHFPSHTKVVTASTVTWYACFTWLKSVGWLA